MEEDKAKPNLEEGAVEQGVGNAKSDKIIEVLPSQCTATFLYLEAVDRAIRFVELCGETNIINVLYRENIDVPTLVHFATLVPAVLGDLISS